MPALEASIAYRIALCQNRNLFRNASLGIQTHELTRIRPETLPLSCLSLSESSGNFPAPIGRVVPAQDARVKSSATCHRQVSYDTKRAAIAFDIFPPLNCVEWHLPGPDWTNRSCAKSELIKPVRRLLGDGRAGTSRDLTHVWTFIADVEPQI